MDIKILEGKTLESVTEFNNDQIIFIVDNNEKYRMHHYQGCCESVYIESINGNLEDLVGSPITLGEEVSNYIAPEDSDKSDAESFTWTFYRLATVKGYVDIRWYGTSNGYYSGRVDFDKI